MRSQTKAMNTPNFSRRQNEGDNDWRMNLFTQFYFFICSTRKTLVKEGGKERINTNTEKRSSLKLSVVITGGHESRERDDEKFNTGMYGLVDIEKLPSKLWIPNLSFLKLSAWTFWRRLGEVCSRSFQTHNRSWPEWRWRRRYNRCTSRNQSLSRLQSSSRAGYELW